VGPGTGLEALEKSMAVIEMQFLACPALFLVTLTQADFSVSSSPFLCFSIFRFTYEHLDSKLSREINLTITHSI